MGITMSIILLNSTLFIETIIFWIQETDLSNVYKNESESTAFVLSTFEFYYTIPTIFYLFLVYFFLVDIR